MHRQYLVLLSPMPICPLLVYWPIRNLHRQAGGECLFMIIRRELMRESILQLLDLRARGRTHRLLILRLLSRFRTSALADDVLVLHVSDAIVSIRYLNELDLVQYFSITRQRRDSQCISTGRRRLVQVGKFCKLLFFIWSRILLQYQRGGLSICSRKSHIEQILKLIDRMYEERHILGFDTLH